MITKYQIGGFTIIDGRRLSDGFQTSFFHVASWASSGFTLCEGNRLITKHPRGIDAHADITERRRDQVSFDPFPLFSRAAPISLLATVTLQFILNVLIKQ